MDITEKKVCARCGKTLPLGNLCLPIAVSNRVIFSSYVNEKVAWLAYGDFIRFALSNTNGDVRFGYYVDGEPFCSGSFGELRYSGFLKHGW